jgi:hypothetical protein
MTRIVLCLALVLGVAGCGRDPGTRALTGGAIGAGTGAVIGSTTGVGVVPGVIVGGVGGAVIGAATTPFAW